MVHFLLFYIFNISTLFYMYNNIKIYAICTSYLYTTSLSNCKKIAKNLNLKYPFFIFNKACFKTSHITVLFINVNAIEKVTDFH